jgi:hypothetical protein
VRGIGVACAVFGLVAVGWGTLTAVQVAKLAATGRGLGSMPEMTVFCLLMLAAGALALTGAWGYFRLQPWMRWLAIPIAAGALLASFGFASPVVLYAAWLTWSRRGRRVLSAEYAGVVAGAPGWPRWWQWVHVVVIVAAVAAYSLLFHDLMTSELDQD